MSLPPIELSGGKSVYCFNQLQLERATALSQEDSPTGERIRAAIARLEAECTRNEQATIAFILIQHLNTSA